MKQFDGCSIHFNECDHHSRTRAVRLDDDFITRNRSRKVIRLESDMRDALYQVRIWGVLPISLPLNS